MPVCQSAVRKNSFHDATTNFQGTNLSCNLQGSPLLAHSTSDNVGESRSPVVQDRVLMENRNIKYTPHVDYYIYLD